MPTLDSSLRSSLERQILAAREVAEKSARAAFEALGVAAKETHSGMSPEERQLRVSLRAKARQLGDSFFAEPVLRRLTEECAYEQWHRMLFARFLAENNLLIHPEAGVPVTLDECRELASEESAIRNPHSAIDSDPWLLAARFAAHMLPGIFRDDDPLLQVRFAREGRVELEAILSRIPQPVFTSDDGLGWVYQFWQSKRKNEVQSSGNKIGGNDIAAVTQLFTEPYMVKFLLHNTLGAWWYGKHPDSPLVKEWEYLRFWEGADSASPKDYHGDAENTEKGKDEGNGQGGDQDRDNLRDLRVSVVKRPCAGTFDGWPQTAAELKVMDPCCGSAHFLVEAFGMLWKMRMEEEGLSAADAALAVLRDNLFGLEIDARCLQIAAFNLALAAWKVGVPPRPILGEGPGVRVNLACTGIPVGGDVEDWVKLANGDQNLAAALRRLHALFTNAPDLGSLIDPVRETQNGLFSLDADEVLDLLRKALAREKNQRDPAAAVFGEAAEGLVKAAQLLSGKYHLVATNVPYLARRKQGDVLRRYCGQAYPAAKPDLATCFAERCLGFCAAGGTTAVVLLQNSLFLTTYSEFRRHLLANSQWNVVARLGPKGFQTPMYDFGIVLLVLTRQRPSQVGAFAALALDHAKSTEEKARLIPKETVTMVAQAGQLRNPDCAIVFDEPRDCALLSEYADSYQGSGLADIVIYRHRFWEIDCCGDGWVVHQSSPDGNSLFSGLHFVTRWENGQGSLAVSPEATIRGRQAWGKQGVACAWLGRLPTGLYLGTLYDNSAAVIVPKKPEHLVAVWCFCSSPEFSIEVRKINQKTQVANATLVKVPFDLAHWQKVAEEQYPNGLPEPYSDDPTQWLFHGHPKPSTAPLQVAVARLLGYRWPAEQDEEMELAQEAREWIAKAQELNQFTDDDGVVCLPAVGGEQPAETRLRGLLVEAWAAANRLTCPTRLTGPTDDVWSPSVEARLLSEAGAAGKTLGDYLRGLFFAQHCRLFHNRPFLWHLWDGKRDGFSVIVNYHTLDRAKLERLTYTYLGDWISRQRHATDAGEPGAEGRLVAALSLQEKLKQILDGWVAPDKRKGYDIYVRWKQLREQPIGWDPDLNDGVRMNIRPFVQAGILRSRFTINWNVDRGKNPDGSDRINDLHYTRAEKEAARSGAGVQG